MQKRLSLLLFLGYCTLIQGIFLTSATAQITSDGTTNTTVDVDGNDFTINQGDRAGSNLFHSFSDFSVPNGGSAFFDNNPDIANIFSRVTGGNISNIDGLIRANDANLFLINPAGIIFGAGARLDIGGSFYGSTADSILFEDGEFSATDLDNRPLLTINAPIGLNFRDNPGDIVNNSVPDDNGSLSVSPGATFALLGGDVNFTGGAIDSSGSNVFIGGLSESGTISLDDNFHPSFPDDVARADVSIINAARVDVSAGGGGSITINARNLEVREGSELLAGIREGLGKPEAQAGDITINATDTVLFNNSEALSEVNPGAVGNAGDISITTGSLEVTNGAQVSTSTEGQGNGGSVNINATDSVKFDGENKDGFRSGAFSQVNPGAMGNAGGVSITTDSLEVTNGAVLFVATRGKGDAGSVTITTDSLEVTNGAFFSADTFGVGDAGSVTINATDLVKFDGSIGAFSQVNPEAVGDAGDISINTGSLEVTNGAQLAVGTRGKGDAGSITIIATDLVKFDGEGKGFDGEGKDRFRSGAISAVGTGAVGNAGGVSITTDSLEVTNGAFLSASTEAQGNAGNIILNVEDNITLSGSETGIFADTTEGSTGPGGSINIDTQSVTIQDGANIAVNSDGSGQGGSITLAAEELTLDNGSIKASTISNQGGNITLTVGDILQLIDDGQITASAGTAQAGGDGGNVTINSDFILAFPTENTYEITANAFEGDGGNIQLTTNSFFGREFVNITASSEFGLSGNVTINTLEVDPTKGLVELPTNLIDPSEQIDKACTPGSPQRQSSFVVTGRGGLPLSPTEPLQDTSSLTQWVKPRTSSPNPAQVEIEPPAQYPDIKPIKTSMGDIYPARGIIKTEDGQIILTPYPTDNIAPRTPQISPNCS